MLALEKTRPDQQQTNYFQVVHSQGLNEKSLIILIP